MPKEYIEREAVLNELQEELEFDTPMYTAEQNEYVNRGLKIAVKDIKKAPTADVVEVIRCKDCKTWDIEHISCEGFARCINGESGVRYRRRDDFCSYGERKIK